MRFNVVILLLHGRGNMSRLNMIKGREGGLVWYGMVDVCAGYLAAEASGSSFG